MMYGLRLLLNLAPRGNNYRKIDRPDEISSGAIVSYINAGPSMNVCQKDGPGHWCKLDTLYQGATQGP